MNRKKVALITGASSGLGLSLAQSFAFAEYELILNYRRDDFGFENALLVRGDLHDSSVIKSLHNAVIGIRGDLHDSSVIKSLHDAVIEKGGVDILVNNAGIYINKDLEDLEDYEVKNVIYTNLIAPILLIKALRSNIKENGLIININSLTTKQPSKGETIYGASKTGLSGFSRGLQLEDRNIKVLDIYLGAMRTPMRGNLDNLIDPNEVARFITLLCLCKCEYSSMRINEIVIARNQY